MFCCDILKTGTDQRVGKFTENFTLESTSESEMDFIGYVETVIQIPSIRKYDVVFLVVKDTAFSREVPVLVGTNILRNLP